SPVAGILDRAKLPIRPQMRYAYLAASCARRGVPKKDEPMPVLSNLAVRDIETVVHPYTNLAGLRDTGPLVIERAQGVFLHDSDGKAYIDGMAGLWCVSLGYGNEELVEAATAQMRKLAFAHLFTA